MSKDMVHGMDLATVAIRASDEYPFFKVLPTPALALFRVVHCFLRGLFL